jgi:hypothetical protein
MRTRSLVAVPLVLGCVALSWAVPRPLKEASTDDGSYGLRLTPGRPTVTRALPCRAFLMHRDQDGRREKRWDRTLVNDVAPEKALLHPEGRYLVTLNEFERGGARHALVIYGAEGELLRHFVLADLLGKDDWEHVKATDQAIRWLTGAKLRFDVPREHFVIELPWERTIRIDLVRGTLLSAAKPESLPPAIAKLLYPSAVPQPAEQDGTPETEVQDETPVVIATDPAENTTSDPNRAVELAAADSGDEPEGNPVLDPTDTSQPPTPDPARPVDYITWVNKAVAVPGPSAAPLLQKAIEQAIPWDGDYAVLSAAFDGDPEALNDPAILQWLKANANAISDFRASAQLPNPGIRYKYGDEPHMLSVVLPHLSPVRQLARTAVAQSYALAEKGRFDESATLMIDTAAVGAHVGQGATLIESLVGIAMQKLAFEAMLDQAANTSLDDFQPGLIAEAIAETPLDFRSFPQVIQTEHAMLLDTAQWVFEHDPQDNSYRANPDRINKIIDISDSGDDTDPAEVADELTRRGFKSTVGEIREYYKTMTAISQLPFPDARVYMEEIEQLSQRDDFNPLMKMLLPSLDRFAVLRARAESTRRGTELAMHLLDYRKSNGEYPESLEVFGDQPYLVDPLTNQRFAYQRDGDDFKLYSLGVDNDDDDGVHDPRGNTDDHVIWPPPK